MNVDSIRDGIVIDHIAAGCGMKLYRLLGLENLEAPVAMITNVTSRKLGRKDIIKIDAAIDVDLDTIGYVDPGATVNIIRDGELKVPSYVKNDALKKKQIPYSQTTNLEEVIGDLDILYMTRVQRERFFNEEDYLRLRDSYILTPEKMKKARADLCVMHPLPRVNEISVAVDDDPRACYFKQVLNGKYMRMALILMLLKEAGTL